MPVYFFSLARPTALSFVNRLISKKPEFGCLSISEFPIESLENGKYGEMKKTIWMIVRDCSLLLLLGITPIFIGAKADNNRTSESKIGSFIVDASSGENNRGEKKTAELTSISDTDHDRKRDEIQWSTLKRENASELRNESIRWSPSSDVSTAPAASTPVTISNSTAFINLPQNGDVGQGPKSPAYDASTVSSLTPTELPSLHFDPYIQTHSYRSDMALSFDDRGMWMLYEATNWFLSQLQPDQFPDCKLLCSDNPNDPGSWKWDGIWFRRRPPIAVSGGQARLGTNLILTSVLDLLTDDDLQNGRNILLALQRNHAQVRSFAKIQAPGRSDLSCFSVDQIPTRFHYYGRHLFPVECIIHAVLSGLRLLSMLLSSIVRREGGQETRLV